MKRRMFVAAMIMMCAGSVVYRAQLMQEGRQCCTRDLAREIDVTVEKKANNCQCLEQFGYCPCAESKRQGKVGCGCDCK